LTSTLVQIGLVMRERHRRIIWYDRIMRTTLSTDDDVLEAARCLAEARGITLGEAVSTMARRGMVKIGLKMSPSGILVFDTPDDFPTIDEEDVRRILADFP